MSINTCIHTYILQNGSVNAFYSTPTRYLDSLHDAGLTWELKTDDFFPYADCPWCYWTGYFTSRVALKGYVRTLNGYLQVTCLNDESLVELCIAKSISGFNCGIYFMLSLLKFKGTINFNMCHYKVSKT